MRIHLTAWWIAGAIGLLAGCATTRVTVIDAGSDLVRLGKGVKGPVYIWRNGEWVHAGRMELPEGWYAGPGPKELRQ